jgi:NAD(P)-dependent dehydrogenase (short-subunit alcohol dehydrogenase family)
MKSFTLHIERIPKGYGQRGLHLGFTSLHHVLHNNVAIVEVGGPIATTVESSDRVNDVNLKSLALTCTQVLPHMERQGKG